jgi:TonB family protein
MNRNKSESMESDKPDTYEATVLDFLDREMAAVQPDNKKNEQSEELDALMTDLLKQVLTESDRSLDSNQSSLHDIDILDEFPATEEKELYSAVPRPESDTNYPETTTADMQDAPAHQASSPPFQNSIDVQAKLPSIENVTPAVEYDDNPDTESSKGMDAATLPSVEKPIISSQEMRKSSSPVIAITAVCLLVVLGGAAYFFMGSSTDAGFESQAYTEPSNAPDFPGAAFTVPPQPETEIAATLPPEPDTSASTEKPSASSTPSAGKTEPPVKIAVASVALPAAPRNERPSLSQGSTDVPTTAARRVLNNLVPSSAPGRPAPPPAPPPAPASRRESQMETAAPVVSGTLEPAVLVSQVSPRYPELAIRSRQSASVVLDLVIDETGAVVEVVPFSGPAMFHKEAIEAALQWRYRPASIGGTNVRSQSRITMNFSLR